MTWRSFRFGAGTPSRPRGADRPVVLSVVVGPTCSEGGCPQPPLVPRGRCYFHTKQTARLFTFSPDGHGLSRTEQLLVGLNVPTCAGEGRWRELSLAATEAYATDEDARLRGLRWILNVAGDRYEVTT